MKDFKKGGGRDFGGGRGRFDRGRFGKGRERGPVTMHQAICDQCHKPCEVPFKPTGDKPVYCNVCFESKRESRDNWGKDRFSPKSYDSFKTAGKGNNNELKKQLEMLNEKVERLIKIAETLSSAKSLVAKEKVDKGAKAAPIVKVKKVKKVSKK